MSYTETHIGKLRKVELEENQTLEDWCREKCQSLGKSELASYNSNWIEQFRDEYSEKYFIVKGEVWEAFEHKEVGEDNDDIYDISKNDDGTLSFIMRFYNGGTCLTECIEEELEKLQ